MDIIKAGWVQRLSSFVRKWKRSWLVLYKNGHLAFFESPQKNMPDEIKILPGRLAALFHSGLIAGPIILPEGKTRDCLMQLVANDAEEISLICGDNLDDILSWHGVLDKFCGINPSSLSQTGSSYSYNPSLCCYRASQVYYGPGSQFPAQETNNTTATNVSWHNSDAIVEQRNPSYFANRYQSSGYYAPRTWMIRRRDGRFY